RTRGGGEERAECAHRRGLPRAVGAEEAEHLATAHLERDVLERDAVTEPLREADRGQGWTVPAGRRCTSTSLRRHGRNIYRRTTYAVVTLTNPSPTGQRRVPGRRCAR